MKRRVLATTTVIALSMALLFLPALAAEAQAVDKIG